MRSATQVKLYAVCRCKHIVWCHGATHCYNGVYKEIVRLEAVGTGFIHRRAGYYLAYTLAYQGYRLHQYLLSFAYVRAESDIKKFHKMCFVIYFEASFVLQSYQKSLSEQ